jgi:hypothetical protein
MQLLMVSAALLVVFFVLFTTRDILLRTNSFLYQVFCIVLVAVLPLVGFLIYLLIRPARTVADRRLDRNIAEVLVRMSSIRKPEQKGAQPQKIQKPMKPMKQMPPKKIIAASQPETMPMEGPPEPPTAI